MNQMIVIDPPKSNEIGLFDVDLRKLWTAVLRNRWWIVGVIGGALALGVIVSLLITPQYEASVVVQIDQQGARVLNTDELTPTPTAQESERFLQTQVGIIRSRATAIAVANDLKLFDNPGFLAAMGADEQDKPVGALSARDVEHGRVLYLLQDRLDVDLPPDSRLAKITFRTRDPVLAARIANSYADNFIEGNLDRSFGASAYARRYLAGQLDDARKRLEDSERAAIAYARNMKLISVGNASNNDPDSGQGTTRSLLGERLVKLNAAYADAVSARLMAEQRLRAAGGSTLMSMPDVLENRNMQSLLDRKTDIDVKIANERAEHFDDHPDLQLRVAEGQRVQAGITAMAGTIRDAIAKQYRIAAEQEQALARQLETLKQQSLAEQDRNIQLSILQRAVDTNRTLYGSLLQRYRELSAQAGVQPNNLLVIDRAHTPVLPVSPKILLNMLVAFTAGLVAAALLVFAREQFVDAIRSGEEVQAKLGLPLLGVVPDIKEDLRAQLDVSRSDASEAYNSTRASLMLSSRDGMPRTVEITSAQAREGKTSTAYALALCLGRIGKQVLVIDLDLRRPAQHNMFGATNGIGAVDYLTSSKSFGEVVQKSRQENVSLIPSGDIPPNPTEILSGVQLKNLLIEARQTFDVVLIDSPPILGLADTIIISALVDTTVLVVEAGRNHRGVLRGGVARLQKSGAKIAGVILTKFDRKRLGYGYTGYGYDYYASGATAKS